MNVSDRAQEILERYWIDNKEKDKSWMMEIVSDDPIAMELVKASYAIEEKGYLELTKKGWDEAHSCVRRHRLAECLLSDVLDVKQEKIHELGCKFEHALSRDVEENICTLLGHPKTCPHGRPIAEGVCCREDRRHPRRLVLPLTECEVMERARIVYIKTDEDRVMNKLTAMGILPGINVQLLKKVPAYLFQMGESQFAIDKGLAEKIHVRLSK